MFETLSHLALQQYWWVLISLLGAILVFLMFVQGGQTLIYTLGKTETERTMLINVLGRKWGFTFTTLVTFGGAFFASFPLFYSTSFGGAYWVWMVILLAFVLQAFGYEFRNKANNLFGTRTYEIFLFINGLIGTVFIGTAVATFFTGSPFSVNTMNLSQWETPWHGLELALNAHNLSLGVTVFFLTRTLALLFFLSSVNDEVIEHRVRKQLWYNAVPFVVFFLTFVVWLMLRDGFAVNPDTTEVFMQPFKYFNNLIEMPLALIIFLTGVLLVLCGIIITLFKISFKKLWLISSIIIILVHVLLILVSKYDTKLFLGTLLVYMGLQFGVKPATKGIWFAGSGTILTVFALLLIAGFNNTSYYPSYCDLQSSLTIQNSSSSYFTLTAMSYVSLFIPFVLAYIWYAWRALTRKKIDRAEVETDENDAELY
ncbi:MAG: cytochrome d ubiquinol oxidase subunit II [Cytophagaceae bacterium]|jgi:cytochrome d ubiquinol oxidase subunit II|nr:cytochrome d ubiquinol oxidase subunit II [Cytophagaceae bacterium]